MQVNQLDAIAAGVSLVGATPISVSTVAGTAALQLVSGVQVSIEGSTPKSIDLLVDTSNSTKPLLAGRQILLAAFDLGFNVSEWLHKQEANHAVRRGGRQSLFEIRFFRGRPAAADYRRADMGTVVVLASVQADASGWHA